MKVKWNSSLIFHNNAHKYFNLVESSNSNMPLWAFPNHITFPNLQVDFEFLDYSKEDIGNDEPRGKIIYQAKDESFIFRIDVFYDKQEGDYFIEIIVIENRGNLYLSPTGKLPLNKNGKFEITISNLKN